MAGEESKVFTKIYQENKWGDSDSRSGSGSNFDQTKELRTVLPEVLRELRIRSLLDIPCGDFYWMKEIRTDLSFIEMYIGGDVVNDIVESNREKYAAQKFRFEHLDLTSSKLPSVDLIFSRDCLVHLTYSQIFNAVKNIKASKAKYLLMTSFIDPARQNKNVPTGGWRPLNFEKAPFNFPKPRQVVMEKCTEDGGIYADKALLLWETKDINLSTLWQTKIWFESKSAIRKLIGKSR